MSNGGVIKEFLVGLGFEVDKKSFSEFNQGLVSAGMRVAALAATINAAAVGAVAAITSIASGFEKLDKLAARFRTTAEALDVFIDSAKILGMSEDKSVESLTNLDRAVQDTAMGIGRTKIIFEELGISVKDSARKIKPTTQVLAELSEKFKTMERGQQLRVMERLGLDPLMLRVLNSDLGAINAQIAEIEKAAGIDLGQAVEQSKSFMKVWRGMLQEFEKLKLIFTKTVESIAVKAMPDLQKRIKTVTDTLVDLRKKALENLPKVVNAAMPIIEVMLDISAASIRMAKRTFEAFAWIIEKIVLLNEKLGGVPLYIAAIAAAWKILNLSFLASPLGIILSLAAAIALLVEDFITWKEGGEAAIDWAGDFGQILLGLIGYIGGITAAVIAVKGAMVAWGAISQGLAAIMKTVRAAVFLFNLVMAANPIALVIAAIVALIAAGALLIANWDTVKDWFKDFFGWFSEKFDWLAEKGKSLGKVFGFGENANSSSSYISPETEAALVGGVQNVSQKTEITVNGAQSPAETAKEVVNLQGRVNSDMARNLKGAVR